MRNANGRILASWAALSLAFAACDGGGGGAGAATDVPDLGRYAGGCEHMAAGPASAVTAVAWGAAGAPGIGAPHTRYDVSLAAVAGGQGGDVAFPSAEAADHVIALDRDVPLQVLDGSGNPVALEESLREGLPCGAVAAFHLVELGVGTYTFRLGPTAEAAVSLVVEAAGGHAHD